MAPILDSFKGSKFYFFFQNKSDMKYFLKEFSYPIDLCRKLPGSGINLDEFNFSPLTRKKKLFWFFWKIDRGKRN